jgi:hypothetical protein
VPNLVPILAEVSDKEPSLTEYWLVAVCLSIAVVALRCRHRWMVLPVSLFAGIWAFAVVDELCDSNIGPAIWQELGPGYVTQACAAALMPLLVSIVSLTRKTGRVGQLPGGIAAAGLPVSPSVTAPSVPGDREDTPAAPSGDSDRRDGDGYLR